MKIWALSEEFIAIQIFNEITASTIRSIFKLFIQRSGATNLQDITMEALGRYKEECLSVARPVSYNGYLKYLRLVGDYAVSTNRLEENIFRRLPFAPIGSPPKKTYDPYQVKALKNWLFENRSLMSPWWFWIAVIETLYYTGMRRRQLVQLKLGDVDFVNQTITLRYESSKTKREWQVPMVAELAESLEEYLSYYDSHAGTPASASSYLFSVYRFNPRYKHNNPFDAMDPGQITGFFKRLSRKVGFMAGPHRFRHTLATLLCNPKDGGSPDLFAAQDILGHSKLESTRLYVETNMSRMELALDRLPKVSSGNHKT